MRKKIILFLFIIFMSFYKPSVHTEMAYEIMHTAEKRIRKELSLPCVGDGGGMMDSVKLISMAFQTSGEIDVSQARRMVISCADILLEEVNKSDKIRPYLINYPFDKNNIKIILYIYNSNGRDAYPDKVAIASLDSGKIRYTAHGEAKYKYDTLLTESFEEAKAILEGS